MRRTTLPVFLLLVTAVAPARAADPVVVPPEALTAQNLPLQGDARFVARYMGLVDDRLQLFAVPFPCTVATPDLGRTFLKFLPKVDNVLVEGRVAIVDGERTFVVSEVEKGPSDAELFRSRLEELNAAGAEDPGTYLDLARRAFRSHERFGSDDVLPVLGDAVRRSYQLSARELFPASAENHMRLIEEIYSSIPHDELHGHLLAELAEKFPDNLAIRERLTRLGFKHIEGRWVSRNKFKAQQGFVWDGQNWVRRLDLEFRQVLAVLQAENRTNLILRGRTDRAYKQLAQRGEAAIGMTRRELTEALGFADRVRREQVEDLEVDQWDYGDRRVYLLDGHALMIWNPQEHNGDERALGRELRGILRAGGRLERKPPR